MACRARRGEVHHRITDVVGPGAIGMVVWALNDFLDQVETYFKEVNTVFRRVSEGDYRRKAIPRCLPGNFANSLTHINKAVEAMEQNASFIAGNWLSSQLHRINTAHLLDSLQQSQADLAGHTHCRLGHWYHDGEGLQRFRGEPAYTQLDKPHRAVHHHVQEALRVSGEDWQDDEQLRQELMSHVQAAEPASGEVTRLVAALLERGQAESRVEGGTATG